MHELSLALNIMDIVQDYLEKEQASVVLELELDVGVCSGVEIPALQFALDTSKTNTPFENMVLKINRIETQLVCTECDLNFRAKQLYDPCPQCGQHQTQTKSGKELQIKSILID